MSVLCFMFRCRYNNTGYTWCIMNYSRLLFTIFSAVGSILIFAIWSNVHVYAQQSSSPILSASSPPSIANSPSTTISPEIKAKMCDPGNPDLKVVNTTESGICGIAKTVKPPLLSAAATPPQTTISSPSAAPLAQLPNSTISNNNNNTGITMTTNVPIVLRPLPGGTCPTGYHLVSGTVCIKDLPSTARQTIPTTSKPITTTNATKSFSIPPLSATSKLNDTNPTNNDDNNSSNDNKENFKSEILKSFNEGIK